MVLLLDVNAPMVWIVADVLTRGECAALIARIDVELAADLFRRVADHVPKVVAGWNVVGANERLRCYRYEAGQRFAPHYDGVKYVLRSDLMYCAPGPSVVQ